MGRKPTVNLNMPPHMHPRRQRSGKVYYYVHIKTPEGKRKDVPLGSDYILALQAYAKFNTIEAPKQEVLFGDVIQKYIAEALPKLAANTIRVQKSDIKHVIKFFNDAPLDQIKPMHIGQFLDRYSERATTANRCKRLISTLWNHARRWGYTELPNPCEGIKGHALEKRMVYITDEVFELVHRHASAPLQDALELAYLTGQRPADTLSMTVRDIQGEHLIVRQEKTKQPLRIIIAGQLAALLARIHARKKTYKTICGALLVNTQGKPLTQPVLRNHFDQAKENAIKAVPELADAIKEFWFYDLRAKAADDTSDQRGEVAASNLLGHESVMTTKRHYLRRGKIVEPTK